MADLQVKYQKLATEYAKLRAQLPVLKKAVLDEQAKEENLKESLKEKDQSLRKYEQELDSLTFRNKQLASRVEVLQQELETGQVAKGKKSKQKNALPQPAMSTTGGASVIGEELQSKIEENARLHKQVYEADQEHQQHMMELKDRLQVLESEASQHQHVLDATLKQNKELIEKLTEEKAMLEIKLQKQEKEGKETRARAEAVEDRLKTVQTELGDKLDDATKTIRDKLPFQDTKHKDLNALNVPTHDRKYQLQTRELISQAATLIRELVQGLSNFHTYCEQRSRIYPADADTEQLSDVNKKLCTHLLDNAAYLRPVEQAFRTFSDELNDDALTTLDTATGLQDFAVRYKKYVAYAARCLPYHLLSIEEECALSSCTLTLEAKNMEVYDSLQMFVSTLDKVDNYISILAAQSEPNCDYPRSSHPMFFKLLAKAVDDFHENTKELSKHFNAKVSLEHQLPTATQKLRTTDECIMSSLVSLVTCTSKLSAFLSGNLEFFSKPAGYHTRGSSIEVDLTEARSHPAVAHFRQRAANYMSSIAKPCPESVPYKVAVHNRRTLLSSTESRESLSQQVVTFQDRFSKLEQDKEHWMLESQLLQMKYEKELQKVAELERRLGQNKDEITNNIDYTKVRANTGMLPVDTSMLGKLESLSIPEEGDPRELLIKNHFHSRISGLTTTLQVADSKALNFSAECRALHKRLNLAQKSKEKMGEDLTAATATIAQLKDELQTTTRSYEGQLSMMSEHLAGMNEKLTTQKDEIEILKYQLQNASKGGKKGRLK